MPIAFAFRASCSYRPNPTFEGEAGGCRESQAGLELITANGVVGVSPGGRGFLGGGGDGGGTSAWRRSGKLFCR